MNPPPIPSPRRVQALNEALRAAQEAVPGRTFDVKFVGAYILEVGSLEVLSFDELSRLENAVASLGWRGWGIGPRGIAFKPTTVELD